ncbi:MAG: cellulase family glycosylhydrolase [Phycisphaeraceae bacterium]|nr:cellulase family glycosylhydrolase [Phycisphaeraceae bacterium]
MRSHRSCHAAASTLDRRTFIATSIGSLVGVHALARGGTSANRMNTQARQPGVPASRLATLARGINLSHWVWYPHAQGEAARRAFITDADLAQLVASGFTHARFPFEPDWLWNATEHRLNDASLREYLDAIRRCHGAGLSIIIDAHWSRTPWIKPGEPTHEARMGELERMWSALGAVCRDLDPERTYLEIVNEPHDISAAAWAESQANIARAIRDAAPDHTIMATGASWGSIDGLLALEPLDDPNIVYSFHFYEPHNFTHQGATWGFPPWKEMKGVPWPAERAELERIADTFPQASRDALRWSARDATSDPWTPEALDAHIERAHQWSLTHKCPIYCGEFGAHKPTAPRDARLAWTRALAESLNTRSIGWAMWDYVGGFAIAEGAPGARTLDAEMCHALELRPH